MRILEFIKLALFAITRNKTRAFLTMLGIIIGVGSVIAMIGIGEGSKRASVAIIQNMGSNMIMVFNGGSNRSNLGPMAMGSMEVLREEDATLIQQELGRTSVVAASPGVRTSKPVVYQNSNYFTSIQGVGTGWPQIRGWELEEGRFFNDGEIKAMSKVCVIGKTVQANLFPNGEPPVGQIIRIGKMPFTIVGVLEKKGASMMGDQDDVIVAPYTTVMRKIMGRDRIQQIMVSAMEDRSDLAEEEVTALLRQRMKVAPKDDSPFTIRKQDDWIKMSEKQAGVLTMFLAMAAGISLLVGGIGISNIMLVSVTERTREIGIRRALGATRRSVLWQFLIEAVVLALFGGLLGVSLALGTIWVLKTFTALPAVAESWAVALGLGFSGVVGVAAGFLPALKAAGLDVIDALRYE
ncbi:MAG: ABC transporter permease [Geothrix sp.]|nr:ABC transporter permease [Geothrix sp.]